MFLGRLVFVFKQKKKVFNEQNYNKVYIKTIDHGSDNYFDHIICIIFDVKINAGYAI